MSKITYTLAISPTAEDIIPQPASQICNGQLYTIQAGNTIYGIARTYSVTVEALLNANPQITNANVIYIGQVICIPTTPPSACNLRVLTIRFLTEAGEALPTINGAIRLAARVIVRATFNLPVSKAYFFLEPTGTDACELAHLIGLDCPSAVTGVAETLWEVPEGTLGRVYVVACLDSCCAKSPAVLVIRNS